MGRARACHPIDETELAVAGRTPLAGHEGPGAETVRKARARAPSVLRRLTLVPKLLSSRKANTACEMANRSQGSRRAIWFFTAMALARSSPASMCAVSTGRGV